MKNTLRGMLVSLLLAAPMAAWAEPVSYTVDPVHSSITFTIRHLVSMVEGRFKSFEGTIAYDAADPKNSKVDFTVPADSIFTDNDGRDKHLKGADFFDVAKYPKLEFHSKKVIQRGKNLEVVGDLTMHGVTKGVSVTVTPLGTSPHPMGGTVAGFKTEFDVNRKDFGIVYNKVLDGGTSMLGDEVSVRILVEAGHK